MRSLAAMASTSQKDLFSSVIVNIKNYAGEDPLRPWIQGIWRINQSLPPHVLHEKLPRFLQKCAQTFESDRRYRNDSRYLSVWIQLMDYVDDAKKLLKKMKNAQIGVKRAKFYIAYALYYEKKKKFKNAEKMYQLGAHNLAKPVGELEKSYFQFIQRMKLLRIKKEKRARVESKPSTSGTSPSGDSSQKSSDPKDHKHAEISSQTHHAEEHSSCTVDKNLNRSHASLVKDLDTSERFYKDDPGLTRDGPLEPTISTKEATSTISSMFKAAQEPETISRDLNQVKPKSFKHQSSNEVLAEEEMEESGHVDYVFANAKTSGSSKNTGNTGMQKPFVCGFKILADNDDDGSDDNDDNSNSDNDGDDDDEDDEIRVKSYDVRLNEDTVIRRLKEDTVIRKIVGSTVFDEPKFENACHHGLLDPTVNLKQAMDDINGMFGKPLNFVRTGKRKKEDKQFGRKPDDSNQAFFILADEDSEKDVKPQAPPQVSCSSRVFDEPKFENASHHGDINGMFGKSLNFVRTGKPKKEDKRSGRKPDVRNQAFFILADEDSEKDVKPQAPPQVYCSSTEEGDFFEPTIFTKEAMDEINDLFGKPLDF